MTRNKFIILCTARTGSNYLSMLLRSNPEIVFLGELYNLDSMRIPELDACLTNPMQYLENQIAGQIENKTVGFKIFYEHLTADYFHKRIPEVDTSTNLLEQFRRFQKVFNNHYSLETTLKKFRQTWQYLIDNKNFHIIHLMRRNKLETFVSLKTAYRTNQWISWSNAHPSRVVLRLHYEECRSYFETLEEQEQKHRELFSEHKYLEVWYEDLVENEVGVIRQIEDFLGLPHKPPSCYLKKQIENPMSEVISNYEELKQAFSNQQWSQYF